MALLHFTTPPLAPRYGLLGDPTSPIWRVRARVQVLDGRGEGDSLEVQRS